MPTSYTSLLGLALPVTGELSGTWGDTVNDYITQYLDGSVAGTQTISGSQTAVTLSKTTGSSLAQVGSGSTGSSQYMIINCTGNPASLLTITAPAASKPYIVINGTSTSQQVKLVGSGPTTGVTLESGERAVVAWNGSDFVKIATSTADGVTTFSAGTTGFTPSSATSGAVTLAGTLATTNGGTGLTSFTANRVFYASSTSAIAQSANLTFDGTNLGVGTASPSYKLEVSSVISSVNGSVRGLFYSDTSKLILDTTGSAPISFAVNGTEQMRLTSTGLGIGTSSPVGKVYINGTDTTSLGDRATAALVLNNLNGVDNNRVNAILFGGENGNTNSAAAVAFKYTTGTGSGYGDLIFATRNVTTDTAPTERARITAAGFTRPVAYADTVSALGNTGTATTINLQNANVFTATLTGNCTFTLSNPIATGSSSFTLILTNDGTAGRTVAWAGGAFRFPGGAASLSRTTTANATDIWVFFTPDGGTTWYGNIAMKNMAA